jgi:hydroxymethylbilane synthase
MRPAPFYSKPMNRIRIATRKSPLALAQTYLVADVLRIYYPNAEICIREFVTTGDRQLEWSLSKEGGKGLFTRELEDALRSCEVDLAVHSCKDLPTDQPDGLVLSGFLPREDARDVLIRRKGVEAIQHVATSSPRRRAQISRWMPNLQFSEIRGNVGTRLQKIAEGYADATLMASAGLKRLGIEAFDGLHFQPISLSEMVPAAGQAAIALQCRSVDNAFFKAACDPLTAVSVEIERLFLHKLGGGCQVSYAVHHTENVLHYFHESTGYVCQSFAPTPDMSSALESLMTQQHLIA